MAESVADDPQPFVEAEAAMAQRKKNIEDAENAARIARKIEEGAFESGSCADLQVAANYYLDAAKLFLRADEFAVVNAVLLRKDHLERLIDEAKQKGLCNKRLSARRTVALTPPPDDRLSDDQCRAVLNHLKRVPELTQGKTGAVLTVELAAKGCKEAAGGTVRGSQCEIVNIAWFLRDIGAAEREHRLKAAGCPCEIRDGQIVRCQRTPAANK